jgi:hypothetical protein
MLATLLEVAWFERRRQDVVAETQEHLA